MTVHVPTESRYRQYQNFMTKLAETWNREPRMHEWEAFCVWWEALDDETRGRWEKDLDKGYDRVLEDTRAKVADAIERYTIPVEPIEHERKM